MPAKEAATPPLRRSARVNVRVPVRISGTLPDKTPFVEDTHIITVSKYGAKMKTEQPLEVGMQIKIKPHQRKESGMFRVVWVGRPGTVREGEVGVEYVRVSNLLGIGFPE
jgi:hypothetical protein